jgi:C4-dicarboxylate-specific signal transduction histidine kinase
MLPTAAARRAGGHVRLLAVLAWWLPGCIAPAVGATPDDVLVLYPYGRQMQVNIDSGRANPGYGDSGLGAGFAARPDVPVDVASEFLDRTRFGSPENERVLVTYLRDKYESQPPEVIVVVADAALGFFVRHRAELFPGVPVVHMGVSSPFLRSLQPLPADIVGTPITYDFTGTIEQAWRWHPQARRVVVVTGTNDWDRNWEARLRAEATRLPRDLEVVFLAGLPSAELLDRVRELPPDSIIFTPGFFRDGTGRLFEPRETARLIAAAAPAPVYGPFATFLGTGVVGGYMASYETMGRVAAQTVIQLLQGIEPSAVDAPAALPTPLQLDWRELQRWDIPDSAVPADAIVQFREPTLWETNRSQVLLGLVVMLLQAGLIVALLFERGQRRRTATALARSEQHMRLAAEAAGLTAWVLEDDGDPGVRRVRSRREAASASVTDFRDSLSRIAPQDRAAVATALRKAFDENEAFEIEYRLDAPDGSGRWRQARGRRDPLQPKRILGVVIDITQRKRAQLQAEEDRAALQHMTRVSLLGQLSASIAHQLNQPLASILGNAEAAQKILERTPVDVTELREICADIVAADHHAAQVIRRLSALFRRGELALESLDVNELVRDTLELTRGLLTIRHVGVVTELAPELPRISGDRVQLQQLLLNLIVNACDASAELPEDRRVVTIDTGPQGSMVQMCVTDRGPGVPPEALEKVFEPFWSTRPRGMGMGLAVCRSIAATHHGSLEVRNTQEGGARFCVLLPAQGAR